jgi:Na+/H+ antiporter NhaD/arsenite permease-like protein
MPGSTVAPSYGLAWGLPFLGLLATMALAPLIAPRLWHRHYGKIVALWVAAYVLPALGRGGVEAVANALLAMLLHQYLPYMLLLGTLFVVAGGLRLTGTLRGSPAVNTALLAFGTVLASLIGTIGASLVMLRPLIRANRHRAQTTHVFVFFIILVANIGGALTPLGNPPLLLGYLKGIPFAWPAVHLALPTLTLAVGLLGIFYALDHLLQRRARGGEPALLPEIEKLGVEGRVNLLLLLIVVGAVMLRSLWRPSGGLDILGVTWNFEEIVADAVLLGIGVASLVLTRPATRRANAFAWEPLTEVSILFAALFLTLIPVTAIMAAGAAGPAAPLLARMSSGGVPNNALFYAASGMSSALLDNAPTYLLFFGLAGDDPVRLAGPLAATLAAISAGATFFGGLTYIGNAPNLMIKAIVENQGLRMPSFFGYIGWTIIILLPWLVLVEAVFFH